MARHSFAAVLCSLLALAFGTVNRAEALTLTVNSDRVSNTSPLVVTVEGEGSCPEVSDPIVGEGVVEIVFNDSCPILPPSPGPFEHLDLLGPLTPGLWEIRLIDLTIPVTPPAIVDVVEVTITDPRYAVELMPSPATADDEVIAQLTFYGTCVAVRATEVEPGRIRFEEQVGICDPPEPPEIYRDVVSLGQLDPDDYVVEFFFNGLRVAENRLQVRPSGACIADANTLCLNNGRFRVTAEWTDPEGLTGSARAIEETDDSGLFWFFSADNIEMAVKVLDACATPSEHFWVFAAGLTDVGVELTIEDTLAETTMSYQSPLGTRFETITDTAAFDTCP